MCSIYAYIYHISPSTHCAASHDASKNQLHILHSSFFYPHLRRGLSVLQKPVDMSHHAPNLSQQLSELATSLAKNQGEAHQDLQKIQDNLKKNLELKPWTEKSETRPVKKKKKKHVFWATKLTTYLQIKWQLELTTYILSQSSKELFHHLTRWTPIIHPALPSSTSPINSSSTPQIRPLPARVTLRWNLGTTKRSEAPWAFWTWRQTSVFNSPGSHKKKPTIPPVLFWSDTRTYTPEN